MRGPGRPLSRACLCLRPLSSSPRAPRSYRLTAGLMGALKFPPEKSAHLCHRVFSVGALGRTQLRTGGSPRAVRRLVGTGRARRRRPRGSRDRRGPPGGAGAATPLRLSICYFRKLKRELLENRAAQGPGEGVPGSGLLRRTRKSAPGGPRTPRGSADPRGPPGTTWEPETRKSGEKVKNRPQGVRGPPGGPRGSPGVRGPLGSV